MGRIETTFRRLKKANEVALIPYLMVGHPSLDATRQLLPVLGRQGADLLAFGTSTMLHSPNASRDSGATLSDCIQVAAEARRSNEVPLVLVTQFALILDYGQEQFVAYCAASGIDGLLVLNLPPDEAGGLAEACQEQGVDLIFVAALASTPDEITLPPDVGSGFLYVDASGFLLGDYSELRQELGNLAARVRERTDLPLVVGSHLSAPEHVSQSAQTADGVLVVSALNDLVGSLDEEELIPGVSDFVRSLKAATSKSE